MVDASGDEGMEEEASGGPWFPPHTSWLGAHYLSPLTGTVVATSTTRAGWLPGWSATVSVTVRHNCIDWCDLGPLSLIWAVSLTLSTPIWPPQFPVRVVFIHMPTACFLIVVTVVVGLVRFIGGYLVVISVCMNVKTVSGNGIIR